MCAVSRPEGMWERTSARGEPPGRAPQMPAGERSCPAGAQLTSRCRGEVFARRLHSGGPGAAFEKRLPVPGLGAATKGGDARPEEMWERAAAQVSAAEKRPERATTWEAGEQVKFPQKNAGPFGEMREKPADR